MSKRNRQQDRVQSRSESRRAQRVIQARQAKRKRLLTIIGGAVGAALLVVLLLVLFNRDTSGPAADEPVEEAPEIAADVPKDGRTMGDPNAPVTVVEYGDFQ